MSAIIYILSRNVKKKYDFFISKFSFFFFLVVKFSIYMNRHVFVMKKMNIYLQYIKVKMLSLAYHSS